MLQLSGVPVVSCVMHGHMAGLDLFGTRVNGETIVLAYRTLPLSMNRGLGSLCRPGDLSCLRHRHHDRRGSPGWLMQSERISSKHLRVLPSSGDSSRGGGLVYVNLT